MLAAAPALRLAGAGRCCSAVAAVVDVLRFTGHDRIAVLNLLVVWAGVHQLGFLYADGTLQRAGAFLTGGGLGAVLLLTTIGPYPVSMVGVPGQAVSNMCPPTLALAAHAMWLIGLALLLREPATRWLARARVWRAVVAANGLAMTAFLWHLSAAFVLLTLMRGSSLGGAPGSGTWWATRPVWLAAAAIVTAGFVMVFRRFDAPRPTVIAGASAVAGGDRGGALHARGAGDFRGRARRAVRGAHGDAAGAAGHRSAVHRHDRAGRGPVARSSPQRAVAFDR